VVRREKGIAWGAVGPQQEQYLCGEDFCISAHQLLRSAGVARANHAGGARGFLSRILLSLVPLKASVSPGEGGHPQLQGWGQL